jgi:alpha-mannosidase
MTRVTTPLPQLIIDRLRKSLADLRTQAPWDLRREDLTVEAAAVASLLAEPPAPAQAQRLVYKPLAPGSNFGPAKGDWHQRWCRLRIPAPRASERGRRFLEWRCQGEATAFLDGEPWTGLDGADPVMPLPDHACTLHIDVGLYPASAIWTPDIRPIDPLGARFDACRLIVRDRRLWEAQFDLEVLEQSITARLESLAIDGQDLPLAAPAGLALYHDAPANFDGWDIDHDALRRPLSGAVRVVLRGSARLGTASQLIISWIIEAGCPWLQVELEIDWREGHRLLKFHCKTAFLGRTARFGAPFGSVARPQQAGDACDEAMWEVPGSRWAAVTDDEGTGPAMVTEAKYGFSCCDGDLGPSLLRAPTDPDPKADRGTYRLRFAIGAHRDVGTAERPCTAASADLLFSPAVVVAGGVLAPPPFAFDHLGSLVPAWTRPRPEGGFEVRLHEVAGRRGQARPVLAGAGQQVAYTDFLGRLLPGCQPRRRDGRQYDLSYKPYQILTVQVR